MKHLTKTAGILDTILHIVSVCIIVAAVMLLIALGLIGAAYFFDLPPHLVGSGFEQAEIGFVTFFVAENAMPDQNLIWAQGAMDAFLTLLCLIPAHFMVKSLQAILAPMKNGEPFHSTVSLHLGKLAKYTCSLGIATNLQTIISNILMVKAYNLPTLLISDYISAVHFSFVFDMSFLLVAGVLLLLSYVFRYGEELQQLSDETI